jgi:hypothetical protein
MTTLPDHELQADNERLRAANNFLFEVIDTLLNVIKLQLGDTPNASATKKD